MTRSVLGPDDRVGAMYLRMILRGDPDAALAVLSMAEDHNAAVQSALGLAVQTLTMDPCVATHQAYVGRVVMQLARIDAALEANG